MIIMRESDYRAVPWKKNGGGTTRKYCGARGTTGFDGG